MDLTGLVEFEENEENFLGKGSYGKVYKAKLIRSDFMKEDVAIKIVEKVNIFELTVMTNLRSRFLAFAHGYVFVDSRLGIVMPYYEKQLKFDVFKSLDKETKGKIMRQFTMGLADLHHNNLSHLDFKPNNIMLDENDDAFIIDFGMCNFRKLITKRKRGTKNFIAPELKVSPIKPQNAMKADIWSLGISLKKLLIKEESTKTYYEDKDVVEDLENPSDFMKEIFDVNVSKKIESEIIQASESYESNIFKICLFIDPSLRADIDEVLYAMGKTKYNPVTIDRLKMSKIKSDDLTRLNLRIMQKNFNLTTKDLEQIKIIYDAIKEDTNFNVLKLENFQEILLKTNFRFSIAQPITTD
jgi:serine/threonine protein kinase